MSWTIEGGDRLLLKTVANEVAGRDPSRLACRPGCTECCIGPFPINQLDVWRLRRGLEALAAAAPARAARVQERAREAVRIMGSEALAPGEDFWTRFQDLPCPALDPATGACDLYDSRPLTCRTYGPPVRIADADLPPCHLCLKGATPAEIESARATIDPDAIEEMILSALDEALGDTLVALALVQSKVKS
jgi:Fe-S-cluster containining protein